jgi:23S rRNA (cytosine1962-C5)-methyltransferase
VFATSLDRIEGALGDGDCLAVYSHEGRFVAYGLYNSQSQIRVRLYSWDETQPLDERFWRRRLTEALALRREVLRSWEPAGACRLVFSEADGLSGLVVDQYARWLVLQFTSRALAQRMEMLVELLVELCNPCGIYLRTERGVGVAEGLSLSDGPIWGAVPDGPVPVVIDGLELEVDIGTGQKTGLYLDQRENRRVAARYATGRRVLDVFCYTGGFGLEAARAGAADVLGIDASAAALAAAQRNAAKNRLANLLFRSGDAFQELRLLASAPSGSEPFGMVILDPPKFARHAQAVRSALQGYQRANLLAVRLLEPGGILVTCSCSGHVTSDDFITMLGSVSEQAGRPMQLLARLGQAPDHPVSVSCPETAYLKCVIARVL